MRAVSDYIPISKTEKRKVLYAAYHHVSSKHVYCLKYVATFLVSAMVHQAYCQSKDAHYSLPYNTRLNHIKKVKNRGQIHLSLLQAG